MSSKDKVIYLTRHAQAEHNATSDWTIHDPRLTALGRDQSEQLNILTNKSIQTKVDLILCSPMLRTLETMSIGYPSAVARLLPEKKVIIVDKLQEVEANPCDTPTEPPSMIRNKLAYLERTISKLDFSTLSPGYTSKKGIFDPARISERARDVRRMIRDRPEKEIIVVAHGDLLRNLIKQPYQEWDNVEIKICKFKSDSDPEADFIQVDSKIEPADATNAPTSGEMK